MVCWMRTSTAPGTCRSINSFYRIARAVKELIERQVPGAVDVRIQQTIDYPTIKLDPDRTKMAYSGISHEDTVKNLMSVLNSSTSFDPAFWLDQKTGNHYFVGVTYKEQDINSMDSLLTVPVTGINSSASVQ